MSLLNKKPRSVNAILSGLSSLVAELKSAQEFNAAEALRLRALATSHEKEVDAAAKAVAFFSQGVTE